MEKEEFKLTLDEVIVLEKIADATHNDEWFRIDDDLHAYDAEGNFGNASEAELVYIFGGALGYPLDAPQSGGLSPEEIQIAKACFKRAEEYAKREKKTIVVKCDGDEVTIQNPQGLEDVVDAVVSMYEDSEVVFQEFLEEGKLEIVGLTLCEQAMVFAELKKRLDGDEVTIEGHDGEYARMDLVDYLTNGPAPVKAPADAAPSTGEQHYYRVPVVYEMYGLVGVEAGSAEEAYDIVREHPEYFSLPEDPSYLEDSFRVADDDREDAVASIKMLDADAFAPRGAGGAR